MIIEAAIGDAQALPFEYNDKPTFPNDLSAYYTHPRHGIGQGKYSDDTEMSTAVLEAILAGPLTRESLAHWFVQAFKRENRLGYAGGFYQFLLSVNSGEEFLSRIKPDSDKSGGAMRGWTVGIYTDIEQVIELSKLQASITHNTAGGIKSSTAAALATHYFSYQLGDRKDLPEFLNSYVEGPWATPRTQSVGPKGMDSTHAAIQAIVMHDNLADILKQCIVFTGDVDTVATIALGAASCSRNITKNLPAHLYEKLEDGQWGRPYLEDLDRRVQEWLNCQAIELLRDPHK